MTSALESLLKHQPPLTDGGIPWDEAIMAAAMMDRVRGVRESPEERMRRLRDELAGELVAFHHELHVVPYDKGSYEPAKGAGLWKVSIPVTLFPRRNQGFTRIECVVELATQTGRGLRVIEIQPPPRSRVLARAELGGRLEFKTNGKLAIPVPLYPGISVIEAAGKIYGEADAGPFTYQAVRMCSESEILRGIGARWRLEDPQEPQRVGIESHKFGVVLEVEIGAGKVSGAGYLQAFSSTEWLTMNVGSVWRELRGKLHNFFQRGAPVEAYAEWEHII
ncbi:MAG TPA: hypothetical protein VGP73_18990 [Thermoanaerobaculia bacterium]